MAGKLTLCGTPIGNLEDMSSRAARTLERADVIACEDTRRLRKLLAHLGIRARETSVYNEANERRAAPLLVDRIRTGANVVLVSDAGMPGLSDPGYRLVRLCLDAGVDVDVVPGPSAVVTALAVSGLPPARFVFEGFLPRKQSERRRRLQDLATEERTIVFFESPHRVTESIADLALVLGDRPAAIARELTKMYEEVLRGSLPELNERVRDQPPRGEIVIVVGGAVRAHRDAPSKGELAAAARSLMSEGLARGDALAEVARAAGVRKRDVFDALVSEREPDTPGPQSD